MKKILILMSAIPLMLFSTPFLQMKPNDSIKGHVDQKERKYYHILLSNKAHTATVKLTNLDADADMYLGIDSSPRIHANDCYSANSRTQDEECILSIPASKMKSTSLIVMINGFKESSYKLEVSTKDGVEEIEELKSEPRYSSGNLKKDEHNDYKFFGKKGETYITTIYDISGDADLRVKVGKKATKNTFDCKSTNGGTKRDQCNVTLKKDSWVYINVYGYKSTYYSVNTKLTKKNNLKKLVNQAVNQCLSIKKNDFETFCLNDEHLAYIIDNNTYYDLNAKVYRVDTVSKTIKLIKSIPVENPPYNYASFIKLKNTNLMGIEKKHGFAMTSNITTFYDTKSFKEIGGFTFYLEKKSYGPILLEMKTTNNGTRLELLYSHEDIDTAITKKYKTIYSISDNPDKLTFISTNVIED